MNIFNHPKQKTKEEQSTVIFQNNEIKIEQIVSFGHVSDSWYCQDENEWVSIIEGEGELTFEDKKTALKKGDQILIPKFQKHKVSYSSSPCIWLCVFFK